MSALLGLLVLHAAGSVLMALLTRARVVDALRSPTSTWAAIAGLFAVALGPAGAVLGAALLVTLWRARSTPVTLSTPWAPLAVLSVLVLARPWVPTGWDEFVWLAKARIEALGFAEGVRAALDPAQRVGPAGYPPLWPSAVSWVGLGVDTIDAHVAAGSVLVLLSLASAVEAWWPVIAASRPSTWLGLAVALSAPLVWVHLRSTYLDLPLGLLAVATLGFACTGRFGLASVVAVVMAGFKDEGLSHVLAATVGALAVGGPHRPWWPTLAPAVLAGVVVLTWRLLLANAGVHAEDHSLHVPEWSWAPRLLQLLALHASDVVTWGVFWGVALVVALQRPASQEVHALRWMLLANVGILSTALLVGPEKVREFAENGTLMNRLLMQLWPTAALLVSLSLTSGRQNVFVTGQRS